MERPANHWNSCRFGGESLAFLFFFIPFPPSVLLTSLLPITYFHFSSWSDDQQPCLPVFQETNSCKTYAQGRHRLIQVLAITCSHEEGNPGLFFDLLILHSCSFPKMVALTVKVAHGAHQGNPAVCRTWMQCCLLSSPGSSSCSYPVPGVSLAAHSPTSWLVGGRAASTKFWYLPSLCHQKCKQSSWL